MSHTDKRINGQMEQSALWILPCIMHCLPPATNTHALYTQRMLKSGLWKQNLWLRKVLHETQEDWIAHRLRVISLAWRSDSTDTRRYCCKCCALLLRLRTLLHALRQMTLDWAQRCPSSYRGSVQYFDVPHRPFPSWIMYSVSWRSSIMSKDTHFMGDRSTHSITRPLQYVLPSSTEYAVHKLARICHFSLICKSLQLFISQWGTVADKLKTTSMKRMRVYWRT